MGPIQSFEEFIAFTRRRWILIGSIMLVGTLLSVWYALSQRHIYEVTAVVQLETPRIANDLAPSTVDTTPARRLQTVEQQVMSRDNLLRLINKFGLFSETGWTDLEKVDSMRRMTRINWIESADAMAPRPRMVSGFTIILRTEGRQLAVDVTNELVDQMIALAKEDRLERTGTTLEFFLTREDTLLTEIESLQSRIAEVKTENDLVTAGGLEFRRIEIGSVQEAILEIEREQLTLQSELDQLASEPNLRVTERRKNDLESQISGLETQRERLLQRSAELAKSLESVPALQQQLDLLQQRLLALQEQHAMALQNRSDAETAHRLETNDQVERLNVIERPILPDYPVAPSRKKIAAQGVLATLIVAFGLAFLLELRRPAIRTAVQMEREVGLRPVVEIPSFASPAEAARPARMRWMMMAIGGTLLLLIALAFLGPS